MMVFGSDRRSILIGAGAIAASPVARLLAFQPGRTDGALPLRSADNGVSPMSYGAKGDGVANDRAAVLAAMAYAFDNGLPLDGGDRLYGVDDDIVITRKLRPLIHRLRLKNIAPSGDSQLLYFKDCEQVRIENLYIHTGDGPELGERESRSGLRVEGGSGHKIRNAEATGKGKGRYFFFWRCRDSDFEDVYVHDGLFHDTSVSANDARILVEDDVVEGIRIDDCSNCRLIRPRVRDLLGNATYYTASGFVPGAYPASEVKAYPNMRTRGISGGGNDGITVVDPQISNVDQGIDMSGSGGNWGNKKFNVIGGRTYNCASVGMKYGGQPSDCFVLGHTAENCGMFGFIVGGSTETYKSHNMQLFSCVSLNPGYNDIHSDAGDVGTPAYIQDAHTGFLVFAPSDAGIEGVVLDNCHAIDRQGFYLLGDDEPWAAAGATSARMQVRWTGYTGTYSATFSTAAGKVSKRVTLTNGSTAVRWSGGLPQPIAHPFVAMPAKMQFGFMAHNEAGTALAFNETTKRPLTLNDNCESSGHLVARAFGFHRDVCHLTAGGVQEMPSGVAASIDFNREVEDTMAMHSIVADRGRVYPKRAGLYRVRGMVPFEPASKGYRRIQIRLGDTALYTLPFPAVAGEKTVCQFDFDVEITSTQVAAGAHLSLWAEQNSGMTLEIGADRWLKVERVRPG